MGRALTRALAASLLLAAVLPPLLWPALELARSSLEQLPWASLLQGRTLHLLGVTVATAGAVSLLATSAGLLLALLTATTNLPGRRVALWLHGFPLFLPPLLPALGWFHLLGRQGLLGNEATAGLLFGHAGVLGVLTVCFTPVATLLCAVALRGVDPSLVEAARASAPPWRVALRILIPATRPAWLTAAAVIFALTLSEIGVPMFLRVAAYPAAVFARLGGVGFAPGEAAMLTTPLLLVSLSLVALGRRYTRGRSFAVLGLRQHQPAVLPLGRRGRVAMAIPALAVALALAPLLALLHVALSRGGLGQLPFWIGGSLWTSLSTAALAASLVLAAAVVVGHGLRHGDRLAGLVDGAALTSFLVPAAALGVGLISVWSATPLYGNLAIIVLGFVARYAVVGIRATAATMAQSPSSLEAAAAAFGAGYLRRLLRIVVPVHARGLLGAWLLTFIFCLRDLETAVLYYPPGGETLTVRIMTLEANGPEGVVAALCLVQVGVTAAGALLGSAALGRGAPQP